MNNNDSNNSLNMKNNNSVTTTTTTTPTTKPFEQQQRQIQIVIVLFFCYLCEGGAPLPTSLLILGCFSFSFLGGWDCCFYMLQSLMLFMFFL